MAVRREITKVQAEQLGLPSHSPIEHLRIYDHLTSRLQSLLFQAKRFQNDKKYMYCWTKNGSIFLRKTESSQIIRVKNLENLVTLADESQDWNNIQRINTNIGRAKYTLLNGS